MNKLSRNLFIFILIIIFIIAFASSYLSLNIDNLAYILAIGIDKAEDNLLQVTFQFSTTTPASESGTMEKTPTITNSVEASSISTAINLMNGYMGKQLNMSHCKVIIFSEKLASEGISKEIYTLINDTQVRPSTNIIISKCTAKNYIQQTTPELENLTSKYYEILTNSSKYTGFMPDATIGDFFNCFLCRSYEPTAILGGLTTENNDMSDSIDSQGKDDVKANNSPIEGQNGSENIGVAVFKEDKLVGELSSLETISLLIIRNKIDRFLVSVPDPTGSSDYIDIYLTPKGSPKIDVDTSTPTPFIKLKTSFTGRIYSMSNNAKYLNPGVLDLISNSCNQYLETELSDYLYKTAKDFKSDINGFGKYALTNFFTTEQLDNYDWNANYKNSFFDVTVDTSVKSGMLITETSPT